jgi:hypothetical protein
MTSGFPSRAAICTGFQMEVVSVGNFNRDEYYEI